MMVSKLLKNESIRLNFIRLILLLMILLTMLPVRAGSSSFFLPMIAPIIIYFWSIFYPAIFPKMYIFLLGIIYDILQGNPIGFSSFIFLAFHAVIDSQRKLFLKKMFKVVLIGFAIFVFLFAGVTWLSHALFFGNIYDITFLFVNGVITIVSYPVFHRLFYMMYKTLPVNELYLSD